MRTEALGAADAIAAVQASHARADPNVGFVHALERWRPTPEEDDDAASARAATEDRSPDTAEMPACACAQPGSGGAPATARYDQCDLKATDDAGGRVAAPEECLPRERLADRGLRHLHVVL